MRPVPKVKKKKLTPLPTLIKKADKVFHKFIRDRDAVELQGRCCTCGGIGSQAGHFVKATHKKIRWNVKNVHLQCVHCNHFLGGNEGQYALFIVNKYGVETLKYLLSQKGVPHKITRDELEMIIRAYE